MGLENYSLISFWPGKPPFFFRWNIDMKLWSLSIAQRWLLLNVGQYIQWYMAGAACFSYNWSMSPLIYLTFKKSPREQGLRGPCPFFERWFEHHPQGGEHWGRFFPIDPYSIPIVIYQSKFPTIWSNYGDLTTSFGPQKNQTLDLFSFARGDLAWGLWVTRWSLCIDCMDARPRSKWDADRNDRWLLKLEISRRRGWHVAKSLPRFPGKKTGWKTWESTIFVLNCWFYGFQVDWNLQILGCFPEISVYNHK